MSMLSRGSVCYQSGVYTGSNMLTMNFETGRRKPPLVHAEFVEPLDPAEIRVHRSVDRRARRNDQICILDRK